MARKSRAERKADREKRRNERKNNRKNVTDKLKQVGGFAPLLPFKPMMVLMLKKKGEDVKLSTPMSKLAPLFRDVIVRKKTTRNYADLYLESLAEEEIISIVREVLDFIKSIAKKKETGQNLTPDEDDIYKKSKEESDNIEKEGLNAGGNWFKDNMIIIVGAAAVILFLAFRKK